MAERISSGVTAGAPVGLDGRQDAEPAPCHQDTWVEPRSGHAMTQLAAVPEFPRDSEHGGGGRAGLIATRELTCATCPRMASE
jgi:hypothetical protein